MSSSARIEETDLHALVDGELDAERRRRVQDHLLQTPEHAALVEDWRRQNAALRAAFEPVAHEIAPLSLRDAALRAPAPAQGPIETGAIHWGRPGASRPAQRLDDIRANRRRQALLSTLLTLLTGAAVAGLAALVIAGRSETPRPPIAAPFAQSYAGRAALTYATYATDAHPVEIDSSRRSELVAWLKARVGFAQTPDLSGLGLRMLGGRVAPGVAAPAGLLLYERADGARVGLYFERAEAAGAPLPPRAGAGVTAIEWRAAGFAFALVGPLSPEDMQAAAERAASAVAAPVSDDR
ncbi:MAG: anti-sigma factor family protein [Methylocystis sp.]|uniref:anti-sigma factor family protein n=1 Tax=Methylocystis sp. TaxID=1911079 RepID=UPI003DA32F8B